MIEPGDRIGHVRVEGPLAEGGMGAVYVGFDEKLLRPVALKAIRGDRQDAVARIRFLNEARLLSQLDHPNVCRIHGYLESGEEDILILELIRGRTLREALREGIDPARKLVIAESVAGALEAAHGKGIIHRDLKPENVMLTDSGQVKVLDFGLARWEQAEEAGARSAPGPAGEPADGNRTEAGDLLGTPASMSPEQARGEPATAVSDAYALGLLLQELFTGQPPYEPGLSEALLLVKVIDGDTLPLDGVKDPDLALLIRRLEAVAPEARPTVAEAAERLAWIRGKPRRLRLRLLATAVAAAFLLGGVKYTLDLREARKAAEQEAQRADAAARFLEELFQASNPRQARGRLPDARELLARGAERLGKDKALADQPLLRARLLDTLGGIQTELGLYDQARSLLKEALGLRERLRGKDHPEVADTLIRLGLLAQQSGREDAEPLFRRALAIREARLGPGNHGDPGVAEALNDLGMALAARGRFDEAAPILQRALALQERLRGDRDPRVARILHNLAGIAFMRNQVSDAERLLRRALAIREAILPDDDPELAGSREGLAILLRKQGRAAEALPILQRLAVSTEKIYGPEHPQLARTLFNLALAYNSLDRAVEARRLFERALTIDEKALEPGHPQLLQARELLATHCREGHGLGDAESRELCRRHGF